MHVYAWMKRHRILIAVIVALLAFNLIFFVVSPREIVDYIGVENSYFVAFLVAAVGGVSTLTGVALYGTIVTFAAGGAHPLLLGLSAGFGIFLSNSIFYYLAYVGRRSLTGGLQQRVHEFTTWVQAKLPRWLVYLFVYLYLSFSPLSDDILMLALVIGGYRYRQVALLMLAGALTLATTVALFGNLWA